MKHHPLFDIIKLSLPDTWIVEPEDAPESDPEQPQPQPQASEATAFNEAHEQGHLNIKCFQIATGSAEQQKQLLDSVFSQTEKVLLANQVYWGVEELQGEEEGSDIAIKRWLVCSMQNASKFHLLIFNYSVAAAELTTEAVVSEIALLNDAIESMKWL